ncbi:MAG: transposase, partial [Dehalococcoidia bacterium]
STRPTASKRINELRGTPGTPIWQRNYYEHVIRNEDDLAEIGEYIMNNLMKWEFDKENPKNI